MKPEGWQGPGPAAPGWGGFRASGGQVWIGPHVWEDVEVRRAAISVQGGFSSGFLALEAGAQGCHTLRQTHKTGSGLGEGLETPHSVLSSGT